LSRFILVNSVALRRITSSEPVFDKGPSTSQHQSDSKVMYQRPAL